jgi:hypothetical protein
LVIERLVILSHGWMIGLRGVLGDNMVVDEMAD